jgi:hypothetical protein
MADWGAALTARLLADAALAAAVGARIDWNVRPDKEALPAVILQTVSDPRPDHFGGEQDFRQTRVQVDCWSLVSADHATQIAEKVIAAVRPVPGQAGSYDDGSWERDGVRFDRPQVEGPVDGGEQLDTVYVHRARVDVLLWHSEMEGV